MPQPLLIRQATAADIARILDITDSARAYQRALGFRQWDNGYPSEAVVRADVASGHAYVMTPAGATPHALAEVYVYLPEGDPSYDRIGRIWHHYGRYGAIHRLAASAGVRGRRCAGEMFRLIEGVFRDRGINIIRVDTGVDNVVMRRLLPRQGFAFCGEHVFDWGLRLAYDKIIAP